MRTAAAVLIALAVGGSAGSALQSGSADPHNLAGAWELNTWLTDPGDQIAQEIRSDLGPSASSDLFGAPEPRGGAMRGPMGRRGTPPPENRGAERPRLNAEEQKRVEPLLDVVRLPAVTLTISQASDSITIVDPVRGSHTFHATGAKEKLTFDSEQVDAVTRWEGPALVTDFDAGHGVSLRFTYMIVPPANELLVRISVMTAGNEAAPFTVRHVYDKASR